MKDILGFVRTPHMKRVMALNGFYGSIMKADKKVEGGDGGLPSGMPIPVLPVDYLKNRPSNWISGPGSYVVPIRADWALWFNWTMNNKEETAVIPSIKGINPLTGQKFKDLKLKRYENKCPVHDVEFTSNNLCPKCGYRWPDQNYYSYPNPLYCDGFLQPNGKVRQFYFTEDMSKSIPDLLIGEDNTVPAFGFCFYSSKSPKNDYEGGERLKEKIPKSTRAYGTGLLPRLKEKIPESTRAYGTGLLPDDLYSPGITYGPIGATGARGVSGMNGFSCNVSGRLSTKPSKAVYSHNINSSSDISELKTSYSSSFSCKEVGIGAGAEINQKLLKSYKEVADWKDEPAAVIRLYFVFQEEFESYVSGGLKNFDGTSEGYLKGLPVGGKK